MNEFTHVTKLPDVGAAVLSDPSGALLEWHGNIDGEAAGAINAFSVQALSRASDLLGLGTFQRASFVGGSRACLVTTCGGAVLGVYVEASKPLGPIEKKVQDIVAK